ncbi:MAG: hypothetical protein PHN88_16235 [Ignavibacteria bacterium]|nr:hypothetical protein [Ignavibacteria bacterium]
MAKQAQSLVEIKAAAKAKLLALGFNKEKTIGMSVLKIVEGDSVLVKIKSAVAEFETKKGEKYDYVLVDNLETGETDQHMWLSGQLTHALKGQKDGFIGGDFQITHLGKVEADIDGKTQMVNQFDIIAISDADKNQGVLNA